MAKRTFEVGKSYYMENTRTFASFAAKVTKRTKSTVTFEYPKHGSLHGGTVTKTLRIDKKAVYQDADGNEFECADLKKAHLESESIWEV